MLGRKQKGGIMKVGIVLSLLFAYFFLGVGTGLAVAAGKAATSTLNAAVIAVIAAAVWGGVGLFLYHRSPDKDLL
jgi:hypothetical protein